MNLKQNAKWIAMFVVPLVLLLAIAYVFVRSQNRSLQSKASAIEMQNDIMQGELYRLRQEIEGRDARIRQLVNPDLVRLKAASVSDSTSLWLFWRESDGYLYVEVSHIRIPTSEEHYRVYLGDGREHLGNFEALSETIGLQRIGQLERLEGLTVTRAFRDLDPTFSSEIPAYRTHTDY